MPEKCDRCELEGSPQKCPGDGATHRHGRVHTRAGRLEWVCDGCVQEVIREWGRQAGADLEQYVLDVKAADDAMQAAIRSCPEGLAEQVTMSTFRTVRATLVMAYELRRDKIVADQRVGL